MFKTNIRFDRHELAGSFGDIGTDLPLIVALIAAAQLDVASTFIVFGLMQIMTGFLYGLPMPMQPLKAMAVIVISQKIPAHIFYAGGLSIGVTMLFLTTTGLLTKIVQVMPLNVVRGVQFGLGLSLTSLALKDYVPSMGISGIALAVVSFLLIIILRRYKIFPAALVVIVLGLIFAAFNQQFDLSLPSLSSLALPQLNTISLADIWTGFILLAIPQIPLSISNSVIATDRTIKDLFPEQKVSIRKIGLTYSLINLLAPFVSGIPACHGCGGLAGHYAFGARTGGSVIIYGAFYLTVGVFFSEVAMEVVKFFPRPILGVILFFEAQILLMLIADITSQKKNLAIALIVASISFTMPHGYFIGLLVGVSLNLFYHYFKK